MPTPIQPDSMPHRDTVVVIPCYNEEERLPVDALVEFSQKQRDIGLLLVDDGSTDATAELLRTLTDRAPDGLASMSLERNRGKAEAVRRGINHVLEKQTVSYTGYWDADLATPLGAIRRFRDVLEDNEDLQLVMGSRVKLLGREVQRSELRHYLGRVFATAASMSLGLAVYDTQCGAKLFRVDDATRSIFREPFLSRWIFDVEVIARLSAYVATRDSTVEGAIYEYPLEQWIDVEGSKVRLRDYIKAALELWAIRRKYSTKR